MACTKESDLLSYNFVHFVTQGKLLSVLVCPNDNNNTASAARNNGTAQNDNLIGTPDNDRMSGSRGNDTLVGLRGDNMARNRLH